MNKPEIIRARDLVVGDIITASLFQESRYPYNTPYTVTEIHMCGNLVIVSAGDIGGQFAWDGRIEVIRAVATLDLSRHPQICPRCSNPAYIGFTDTECSVKTCR